MVTVILAYMTTAFSLTSQLYKSFRVLFTKYLLFPVLKTLINKFVGFSLLSICVVKESSIAIDSHTV